jgi:methionyl-tRNA formyltransferase
MKIVFMGTPAAAVPTLQKIVARGFEVVGVYTQPDKPAGRGRKISVSPVKAFATKLEIPVFQPESLKSDEVFAGLSALKADVVVVVAYGKILPKRYLYEFPMGAINVHFSLLPKYRGAAPVNWAIALGENKTGVTTMLMDEGLDTGPILLSREVRINDDENAIELTERLSEEGASLLIETLERFGYLQPIPQDNSVATYAPVLRKSDGLIDWQMKARDIVNRVRGFQPFPTAYTLLERKKLTIWRAAVSALPFNDFTQPGTVLMARGRDLVVSSGENTAVSILEAQLEGRKRLSSEAFLNGVTISQGTKLG